MTKQNENLIYVITHKPIELDLPQGYTRLYVGAEKLNGNKQNLSGYVFDDAGIHMSEKNSSYCELTGLYWIWKNEKSRIVGIEHYRRFFQPKEKLPEISEIDKILEHVDVIVPKRQWVEKNARIQFEHFHRPEDLQMVKQVISEQCPEYITAFEKAMGKCFLFSFNMMICKKEIFDDYCAWLFRILEEVEKRTDTTGFDTYQKRIYGFLSERLFLVYLLHHHLKVKEVRVNETEVSRETQWESKKWQMITVFKNIITNHGLKTLRYQFDK